MAKKKKGFCTVYRRVPPRVRFFQPASSRITASRRSMQTPHEQSLPYRLPQVAGSGSDSVAPPHDGHSADSSVGHVCPQSSQCAFI